MNIVESENNEANSHHENTGHDNINQEHKTQAQNLNQLSVNGQNNENQLQNHQQINNEQRTSNDYQDKIINGYGPENQYYNSPQETKFQQQQDNKKYSPEKLRQQHFLLRQMPLHRAPWNERFYISTVTNNAKTHSFFKEYFDKPMRQNAEHMIKPSKPDIPIEEFYRSSSLAQLLYDHSKQNKKIKRRDIIQESLRASLENNRNSQEQFPPSPENHGSQFSRTSHSQKNLLVRELNWQEKFNVMASKNNIRVHKNFREFFDKPIEYDPRGYLYSRALEPMTVYDTMTPIVKNLKSLNSSQSQRTGLKAEYADALQGTHQRQNVRMVKTSQGIRSQSQMEKNYKTSTGTNFYQTGSTKSSLSNRQMRKQNSWNDRIGLPISSYNEKVFPKYRILFNNL